MVIRQNDTPNADIVMKNSAIENGDVVRFRQSFRSLSR
jgi:hypothetical protein